MRDGLQRDGEALFRDPRMKRVPVAHSRADMLEDDALVVGQLLGVDLRAAGYGLDELVLQILDPHESEIVANGSRSCRRLDYEFAPVVDLLPDVGGGTKSQPSLF